ncbi:hypothetical protein ACSBLW_06055 [Thioclava sp. FR2]|uniref:hypothetical protein n=1 Tax=Thioclava sp. FR2 TaxID=3445780 RepID=UPI003EBC891C
MLIHVNTGNDARTTGAEAVDAADLGVRYTSFRSLDRFDEQVGDINFGMVSWPGGYLAEAATERFGLQYDGLYNPSFSQPGLGEMISFANSHDAGINITLPTLRYAGNEDLMRADVRGFMTDLLSGHYGALPSQVILSIGSEYYHHFSAVYGSDDAAEYGNVASAMVNEINACLNDPAINRSGVQIDVSVQAGRSLEDDEEIRDAFSAEDLASVDLVTHHRYPGFAEGVDFTLNQFQPTYEAWVEDVTVAGGDRPELNLGEWGVATVTREEALTKYIRDMRADGITVRRGDVDLEGRTDDEFEQYWQDLLETRDYGIEQPRLYLEVFSEYQAEGMGSASLLSWDMVHAGRDSYVDVDGNAVQFVGADMVDMIYESVEGLTVMDISTQNSRNSDLWTYGFENDDRLVMFLAADDDATVGEVTLDIEGLGDGYAAVWVESLTSEVPADWMERFDIIDNPNVDESAEANTYAIGVRSDLDFTVNGDAITFSIDHPGEVVRIVVARTPEEAEAIAEWAGEPDMIYSDEVAQPEAAEVSTPVTVSAPAIDTADATEIEADNSDLFSLGTSWRNSIRPASGNENQPTLPETASSPAMPSSSNPFNFIRFSGRGGAERPSTSADETTPASDDYVSDSHRWSSIFGAKSSGSRQENPEEAATKVSIADKQEFDIESLMNRVDANEDTADHEDYDGEDEDHGTSGKMPEGFGHFADAIAASGTVGLIAALASHMF